MSSGLWYNCHVLCRKSDTKIKKLMLSLNSEYSALDRSLIAKRESNVLEDIFLYVDTQYNLIASKSCSKMIINCSFAFMAALCCP